VVEVVEVVGAGGAVVVVGTGIGVDETMVRRVVLTLVGVEVVMGAGVEVVEGAGMKVALVRTMGVDEAASVVLVVASAVVDVFLLVHHPKPQS